MSLRYHTPLPPQCHSHDTLQCHSGVHIPLPLCYYHFNATPECLWSVNLNICDALLCHSNATPIPLHKAGVALQCTLWYVEIAHSIDAPKTLYCHSVRVRGKGCRCDAAAGGGENSALFRQIQRVCRVTTFLIQWLFSLTVLIYRWPDLFWDCISLCWINHVWVWDWVYLIHCES